MTEKSEQFKKRLNKYTFIEEEPKKTLQKY